MKTSQLQSKDQFMNLFLKKGCFNIKKNSNNRHTSEIA